MKNTASLIVVFMVFIVSFALGIVIGTGMGENKIRAEWAQSAGIPCHSCHRTGLQFITREWEKINGQ
jgi:hypothetical protein